MADITFNAEKREKAGKGAARACRREGRVPAVIYGGKQEPVMISLHPVELEKALDMVGFYDADIEIAVDGNSTLIGSTFAQLGLPKESRVCALIRKGETMLLPGEGEHIEEGDVLVFFTAPASIRRAEKIFA